MKKVFALLLIFTSNLLMAQDLDTIWKEIDTAYREGNLKSIQPKVDEAIALARAQNKVPFLVRGLFYDGIIKITTSDDTDDVNPVFENFRKETASAEGVNKSILQIYSAKLYQVYFDENRYRIIRRTDLENPASEDIRFWTEPAFKTRIKNIYETVLAQKDLLLQQPSGQWKDLFQTFPGQGDSARYLELSPTLYDAFTHHFIAYLQQTGEPVERRLEELAALQKQNGHTNASLYSRSLALNDQQTEELEHLVQSSPQEWYTGELYKRLAGICYAKGHSEKDAAAFQKVLGYEEKVKTLFPGSEAEKSVSSIADAVRATSFSIETEKYIPEKKNTPFRVSHRNLDKIYVKVLDYTIGLKDLTLRNASRQLGNTYKDSEERYSAFLKQHKTIQEYAVDLKPFGDYLEHSSLFNLKPLPKGRYIVLFSEDPEFRFKPGNALKYAELNVTDPAVEFDGESTFRATDRTSGKPLTNRKIEIYKYTYNHATEKETCTLLKTVTTDARGQARYSSGERQFIYRLQGEQAFYGENLYRYDRYRTDRENKITSTKIFTDRAIYRPGQTVYFKAIATSGHRKEVSVLPKREITVTLRDANRKELSVLKLKTNDFGSVNGEFALPSSVLTGSFSIETSLNGYYSFRVEEYKRPKFSVTLEMPKEAYQLMDTVTVPGKAIAFSGANIDHARVEYRVYRQAIYPFRGFGIRMPAEPEEQVAYGTAETDAEGKFFFSFKAIPAREQKNREDIRTYVYRTEAAVTDINGETQTGSSVLKVGDRKVLLSAKVDSRADVSDLESFTLLATNLNDQPVPVRGTLKIIALKSPGRLLRKSKYTTDYHYYSKAEFEKLFPNEPYGGESDPENWEKGKEIFATPFNTGQSTDIKVPGTSAIEEGYYLVVLTAEPDAENTQMVYLKNAGKPGRPKTLFSWQLNKNTFEPGETARLTLNTAADNLYVYLKVE
ncbi:MAG: MG2 domain-containing protein, partial [Leadbetterella sp.]|nr:MG2 domain-containing protein [Leadbetterella sp.]